MAPGRAWLATLTEQALSEYLADNESAHTCPSSSRFLYEQTLSNLRITPAPGLLDTIHLVETRNQNKEVKAVIGDLEHNIRATFTKAALDGAAFSTSGVPFERLLVGAIFRILACEIRISDCFDPARIDIKVTSVAVICPGGGLAQFANLKKLEEEPSVLLNLEEYNLRRSDLMDSDGENDEPMASQEGLMTQVPYQSLQAPSPNRFSVERLISPGLVPEKLLERAWKSQAMPPSSLGTNVSSKEGHETQCRGRRTRSPEEPAPSTAHFVTQVPLQIETRIDAGERGPADTIEAAKPEHSRRPFAESINKLPVVVNNGTKKSDCKGESKRLAADGQHSWQKRVASARYLPRYVGTRAGDQQELTNNNASWQPSLIGQPSIEGQVPLQLLERLSRAADASAESRDPRADDEESSEDKEVILTDRGPRTLIATELQPSDSAVPQSPAKSSSETSWEDTPPRPAQIRPRLPPDSSPLQGIEQTAVNESAIRQSIYTDESVHSSAQADQEMPSSPFSEAARSDEEDDSDKGPVHDEAPVLATAQITMPDTDFGSIDQLGNASPSEGPRKAELKEVERRKSIEDDHVENSSNESTLRKQTSSLDSIRKLQVSRTPGVQWHKSDSTSADPDSLIEKNSKQNHRSLPRMNMAESFPPSSSFVPGTYLSQTPKEALCASASFARKGMPAREPRPSRITPQMIAEVSKEDAGQPQFEEPSKKRKRESSVSEKSSERQRNENLRSKPVATGSDPDFWDLEIGLRQYRRERIAEDKQEQRARAQRSRLAAVVNDDNSVESRDRPLSPRSSVVSVAKHRISTPITHSSDYQFSNVGKDDPDRSWSRDLSVDQVAPQDTFELFRSVYPDYEGGRTQFEQACHLLRELGGSAPRSWLWDDFVFRYNNDYMKRYHFDVTKAGELPISFELFYRKYEKEPISLTKVLKHGRLSSVVSKSSLREGTQSVVAHPFDALELSGKPRLSIASNLEPQLPPLPAQIEETVVSKTDFLKRKSQSQSINHSQESSVKIWLEKASGEESPELGTPPMAREIVEVPALDLEATASSAAPATKSKARRVPWRNHDELPSSAAHSAAIPASAKKLTEEKRKAKRARQSTDFPIMKKEGAVNLTGPVIFRKPRPNAETPFAKLAMQFAELNGRRGIPEAPFQKAVDILSWRRW